MNKSGLAHYAETHMLRKSDHGFFPFPSLCTLEETEKNKIKIAVHMVYKSAIVSRLRELYKIWLVP